MPGTVVLPPVLDQPWHKAWPQAHRLSPHCATWLLRVVLGASKGLGPSCQLSEVPEASQSYQGGDGWMDPG